MFDNDFGEHEEHDIIADMLEDEDIAKPHILSDMNYLYESFRKSLTDSAWKSGPQEFELDVLAKLTALSDSLQTHTYKTDPTTEFVLNERGKTRYIHGNTIKDRVVRHNLCDNILTPAMNKLLIYNNGASQKGKGISFTRAQFEKHLHNFYLKHHNNDGYILLLDFSKFYDNISHAKVKEMFSSMLDTESNWLFDLIIDSFRTDITHFPQVNPDDKFDSIAFHQLEPDNSVTYLTRYLNKGIDIGDQTSQNIGVFYATKIDKYVTVARGHRWYGRYMDDIYVIHDDLRYLNETLVGIRDIAEELGLFINDKKTRICKLSSTYKFLQIKYSLQASGRVIRRINPESVTRERQKLKAYKRLADKKLLQYDAIKQAYKSWICNYHSIMSKKQLSNMQSLYTSLFSETARYK